MADLRTYFGAAVMVSLGLAFVAMLFTQSLLNSSTADSGQFPIAGQSTGYLNEMSNKSVQLTNSLNATFSQSTNTDIAQGFYSSAAAGGQIMSIVWSLFNLIVSVTNSLFFSPAAALILGPAFPIVMALSVVYIVGLLALVIAGVVLKWFI